MSPLSNEVRTSGWPVRESFCDQRKVGDQVVLVVHRFPARRSSETSSARAGGGDRVACAHRVPAEEVLSTLNESSSGIETGRAEMDSHAYVRRYVVGVDGSDEATRALELAIRLARATRAEIVAVYAIEDRAHLTHAGLY